LVVQAYLLIKEPCQILVTGFENRFLGPPLGGASGPHLGAENL